MTSIQVDTMFVVLRTSRFIHSKLRSAIVGHIVKNFADVNGHIDLGVIRPLNEVVLKQCVVFWTLVFVLD